MKAASAWCKEVHATVRWTQDERTCTIRVPVPRRPGVHVFGSGPDYLSAARAARTAFDEYMEGPPTGRYLRPEKE